jgi:hypothetical protein
MMSMFSNTVDKILKGAHLIIADLEQHAKNMLRDVAVHSETVAQATEKKLKASVEHQRAVALAARFRSLIEFPNTIPGASLSASQVLKPQVGSNPGQQAASNVAKKPM